MWRIPVALHPHFILVQAPQVIHVILVPLPILGQRKEASFTAILNQVLPAGGKAFLGTLGHDKLSCVALLVAGPGVGSRHESAISGILQIL